jgi:hypothetical protein
MWWLVTWATYASWLPGDPRGFRTFRGREYVPPPKRYAKPGEPTYQAAPYRERLAQYRAASGEPVRLSPAEQALVLPEIVTEVDSIPLVARVLAVGNHHVHLLAKFGPRPPIRRLVGRIKAAATRVWHEQAGNSTRLWSRDCDMKSKPTRDLFESAYRYVYDHIHQGALVHTWPLQGDDSSSHEPR